MTKPVGKYVTEVNKTSLLESSKKYKKLNNEEFSSESLSQKLSFYEMDLESVRYSFRTFSKTLDINANFPRQYRQSEMNCPLS